MIKGKSMFMTVSNLKKGLMSLFFILSRAINLGNAQIRAFSSPLTMVCGILSFCALLGCGNNESTSENAKNETEEVMKEEWVVLFDGTSMDAWKGYLSDEIGSAWIIENETLHLSTADKKEGDERIPGGGDIITKEKFDEFELELEWKISPCGNSGIIYFVQESEEFEYPWHTGPEMQVLDNECHEDATETHRAGDLYDMKACSEMVVKPAGEWNKVRIVNKDGVLQHWLNGVKVVETSLWDDNWAELIANSKFKDMEHFGQYKTGHIALQDHNDAVWYRNIRIKKL